MSRFADLIGTLFSKFQLGIGGPVLKNNSGAIEVRNPADNAYAELRALLMSIYGNDVVLNAGAAGAGDDWKLTISRPSTGMTEDIQVIWPPGTPSPGQVLAVESFAGGVLALEYAAAGSTASSMKVDTTTLAFGDSSPLAMFNLPADNVVLKQQVIIDTPFNGAPSLSIGISGTPSKYMGSTQVDLTSAAGTVFEVAPGLDADASPESLVATYAAGGATAGSARLLTYYGEPA